MDSIELLKWFVATVNAEGTLHELKGKIFPDVAQEGTDNPCLVYQLVSSVGEPTVDEGPARDGTLAYQIRIYGPSRKSANGLREAFRQKFEGMEPVAIGGGQIIEGSAWGELADTFDPGTKDYGALGVIEFHLRKR
ncbi:hypothetical protein [Luteolibacter luteus]|uniref:DUF3168 domain-containing protein n=1 Tax=Luteolibacter luteus TaxID=2728835 RepID=A0A858RFI9_9BACT|nr:hypothetical protein [Luteolibacter luteus]QJE95209.1 hypothetical protein HHL09_05280 [Luteolibacter luteus]